MKLIWKILEKIIDVEFTDEKIYNFKRKRWTNQEKLNYYKKLNSKKTFLELFN